MRVLNPHALGQFALTAAMLGGGCLGAPPPASDGSSSGTTTTAGSSAGPTGSPTTAGATTTTTTAAQTSDPTATTAAGSSGTTGESNVVFFDDFNRPDSVALGNGWVEKTPDAWQILDGRVQFENNPAGFSNDFIYQPTIDLQEVEVSVEFRHGDLARDDYPQVHGRLDVAQTQIADNARSYGIFVDFMNSDLTVIRSNPGMMGTNFGEAQFGDPVVEGGLYRVTIRITGSDPVQVQGFLEREDPGGGWIANGEVFIVDSTPERINDAGAVGTTGNTNIEVLSYDNFMVRDLSM